MRLIRTTAACSIVKGVRLVYLPALDFRSSTHCTDGLMALSARWMQPIQQHGRRTPSASSLTVRSTWFCRVAAVLTVVVQQIHSLRASGVMSCQAADALGEADKALRISAGN